MNTVNRTIATSCILGGRHAGYRRGRQQRQAGEPLLGEVLKGRRLLGSDTSYARLITRHLLDAADFLPYRERILSERRK